MRVRVAMSCTAITCAGAAVAMVGCFSNSSGGGQPQASFDAGFDSTYPEGDAAADTFAPPVEAGNDVTVAPPEAGAEAGPDAAPEAGCAPGSIAGFVVPPYVHAENGGIICQDNEDAWFAQQCFGAGADLETCAAFATSAPADAGPDAAPVIQSQGCPQCLLTPANSDAGWGPGVAETIVVPNVAGCIELADNSDGGISCAMAVQAAAACADFACKSSCPVTDDAQRTAYIACTTSAASGVCATYTAAATACIASEIGDGGSFTNQTVQEWCFGSSDPATQYTLLARFFCSS